MADFFINFLNISITASYIIIAVILFRAIFKNVPKKFICILWAVAGLRLVFPFSIESALSLIPSAEIISPEIMIDNAPRINTGIPFVNESINPVISESLAPSPGDSANPLQIIIPVMSVIWIVGAAAMLIYCIISYNKIRKSVATAVLLRDNIYQCEKVASPFILGIIKPKIYIPFDIYADTRMHVIAHENAHIKRRDHLIKPLGFIILAMHWFNPFVWIAYVLLCRDIEGACDEKVIAENGGDIRKEYATALLSCAVNRKSIAACPLAFGETSVKSRIKGVMNYKKPAFWIILLAIIACIAASVCFLTNPPEKEIYDPATRLVIRVAEKGKIIQSKVILPRNKEKTELINGTEAEIEATNLQTGELVINLSGTPILNEYNKTPAFIVINENAAPLNFTCDDYTVSFEYVYVMQNLEQAISSEILRHNEGKYLEGEYKCEVHETFLTEEGEDSDGNKTVTVYMCMAYGEFDMPYDKPVEVGGCAVPVALTFAVSESGYTLTEYWEASDGSHHADSIKEKFPASAARKALNYEGNLSARLYEKAVEYFKNNSPDVTVSESGYIDGVYYGVHYNNVYLKGGPGGRSKAAEFFEKRSMTNQFVEYTVDTPPISGIFVENEEDFNKLLDEMNGIFSFDIPENVASDSFLDVASQFDSDFFEHKSALIMFVVENSSSISHKISGIKKIDNSDSEFKAHSLSFNVHRLIPDKQIKLMGFRFITVVFDKAITDNCENFYVTYGEDYYGNGGKSYSYGDKISAFSYAKLTLLNDTKFQFMYSLLSSYLPLGTYTLDDEKLILKTDDGLYTYTFKVDGDTFIFDQKNSSPIPTYKSGEGETLVAVPDGAVFK